MHSHMIPKNVINTFATKTPLPTSSKDTTDPKASEGFTIREDEKDRSTPASSTSSAPSTTALLTTQNIDYTNNAAIHDQYEFMTVKIREIYALILQIERYAEKALDATPSFFPEDEFSRKIILVTLENLKKDIITTIESIISPVQKTISLNCNFTPNEFIEFCYAFYKPRTLHVLELIKRLSNNDKDFLKNDTYLQLIAIIEKLHEKNYQLTYPIVYFSQRFYNPDIKGTTATNDANNIEESTVCYKAAGLYNPLDVSEHNRKPLLQTADTQPMDTTFLTVQIFPGRLEENPDNLLFFTVNNRTYTQHCIRGITPRFVPIFPSKVLLNRLNEVRPEKFDQTEQFGVGIHPEKNAVKHLNLRFNTEISGLTRLKSLGIQNITPSKTNRFMVQVPKQPYTLLSLLHIKHEQYDKSDKDVSSQTDMVVSISRFSLFRLSVEVKAHNKIKNTTTEADIPTMESKDSNKL